MSPYPPPRHAVVIALIVFVALASFGVAATASASARYSETIAAARQLAAEGSHALAREKFTAAQALAPDDAQRRWCQLWVLEEEHAAKPTPEIYSRIGRDLEALLAPYEQKGAKRDEFWAEAKLFAGVFASQFQSLFTVAEFWAEQPITATGAESFVKSLAALGKNLAESGYGDSPAVRGALDLLRHALSGPALASNPRRGELALLYARALETNQRNLRLAVDDVTAGYAIALAATEGTSMESEARIYHAHWTLRSGVFSTERLPGAQRNTRLMQPTQISEAEFKPVLDVLKAALATAPAQPADHRLANAINVVRRRKAELEQPTLGIETSEAYLPGSRFSFGLSAQHVAEVELKLYRIELDALHAIAFDGRQPHEHAAGLLNASPLQTWQLRTGVAGALGRASSRHIWREALEPGAYALVARDVSGRFGAPVLRWFLVTKVQAVAQRVGAGDLEIAVFETETGRVAGPVSGKVWRGNRIQALVPVEAGRARLALRDFSNSWESAHVIGASEGHPFLIRHFGVGAGEERELWRLHLTADRPLFQPGETAQWKLTARRIVDGELRVPAGLRLQVAAAIGPETVLGTWEIVLNEFGSASGKVSLPASVAPGRVWFDVLEAKDERSLGVVDAFLVDHFRAPEATLAIEPADAEQFHRVRAGGAIELKATARYFSGEPLANARIGVSVQLRHGRTNPGYFGEELTTEDRNFSNRFDLVATTDARGEARLHLALPTGSPRHLTVTVMARLTSEGISAMANDTFEVLPFGYSAKLAGASQPAPNDEEPGFPNPFSFTPSSATPQWHALPNQAAELTLFARDGRKAPLVARGEVSIVRQTWEEIWRLPTGEILTGEALREWKRQSATWPPREGGWKQVHAAYHSENVRRVSVETDAAGRATIACPPLPAGYYRVLYHADEDAAQNEPLAQLELFVADATTTWLPVHTERPLAIPTPVTPGEPIRLLAILPDENRAALVTVGGLAGGESRLEKFGGNTRLIEFAWQPGFWAAAKVGLTVLSPEQQSLVTANLSPSRAAHAAQVQLVPLGDKSRPGEKAKLSIRTSDSAGRPMPSEIALSVADKAVTSLPGSRRRSATDALLAPQEIHAMPAVFSARPVPLGSVPSNAVSGLEDDSGVVMLSAFEVSTDRDRGYAAMNTLSGSRISVVTKQQLVDADTPVATRGTFSYTAFWTPDLKTDARGEAIVEFSYPDNLTQWQIAAEAIGAGNRFGASQATTQTSLPFQARLRLPRAVVAGDTVGLLGALVNAEDQATATRVEFASANENVLALSAPGGAAQAITVGANSEAAVSVVARAGQAGEALVRLTARGERESDAMELKLPVREDGFLQHTGVTARVAEKPVTVALTLPQPLDPARTTVEIQVSPGFIPALIEPLPYLVDYPYGCVEQTMSRFLPAAIVAKLLHELKLDPVAVERRLLPPTRRGPNGEPPAAGLAHLDDVVAQSITRLAGMQNPDGSFGWFAQGAADPYMTAYVLRGLNIARAAGIAVPEQMHQRAYERTVRFLEEKFEPALAPAQTAWVLAAVCGLPVPLDQLDDTKRQIVVRTFGNLYAVREQLTPAGISLLTQAAAALGRRDELPVLRRNLENGVVRARSAEFGATAQWGRTANYYDGLEGAVETTALSLQALLAIDPQHPLADAAATWLLVNRQSGRWSNTRDTALAVLALHDYARSRGDVTGESRYRLAIGEHVIAERTFDRDALLKPATFVVDPALLRGGRNKITLTRLDGTAPCFLAATAKSWAQAGTAKPMGSFLKLARDYLRIVEQPTLIGFTLPRKDPLTTGDASVARNERVECRLVVEAQNDLEYVAIEVPKPGGCEPVNMLSGWDATLRRVAVDEADSSPNPARHFEQRLYREEHPDRSVFFLSRLPAGRWEIRYQMRATFDGNYRALPATMEAMYVPVLAANSDARRLEIRAADQR